MDGWLMDGQNRPALKSEARKIPKGGRCIPSLGILPQEAVRLGSSPGASQCLSVIPPLAPPFPTWILL